MKFFGRQNEIKELQEIRNLSLQTARFTIVTGRRRSGKTSLLIKAYEDVQDMLYFFVARKSEAELCRDFIEEMTSKLQLPILGEVTRFADIFKYLLQLSKIRPITLIIDEFQGFEYVNPSVYSDVQNLWNQYRKQTHLNLILMGSVFSMMYKIFEGYKEPLFEKYFRLKMMESQQYSAIGSWWERKKGKETDEIDIIGLFAGDKKALIVEVKRLRRNYDHKEFMEKIECVKTRILSKYKIEIRLLTLEDNQFSDMSKRLDRKICV